MSGRPLRIGFDARALNWTGIGRYVRNLLREMAEEAERRALPVEFMVFAPARDCPALESLPRTRALPVRDAYYSLYEQTALPLALARARVDLFHFPNFNVPLLFRHPFVVTVHDLTRFRFPGQRYQSQLRQRAYEWVFRSAVLRARRVIAVSRWTRSEILRFFPAVAQKVTVISEGVEHRFRPASGGVAAARDAAVLARLGVTPPYLLYVGLWMRHKNLGGLLRAFARVRAWGYRGQLVITGKGRPWDEDVRGLARTVGVVPDLRLPGTVADEDLPSLYRSADAFVFVSYSEGFGLPPLEAMACGVPVVASAAGSLPEILGEAALLVDPDDSADVATAISHLLTDHAARERLRARGLRQAARYTWGTPARETLAVYESAAGT